MPLLCGWACSYSHCSTAIILGASLKKPGSLILIHSCPSLILLLPEPGSRSTPDSTAEIQLPKHKPTSPTAVTAAMAKDFSKKKKIFFNWLLPSTYLPVSHQCLPLVELTGKTAGLGSGKCGLQASSPSVEKDKEVGMELRDYRRIASTLLHTHRCFPTDVLVSPDVFYSGLSEAKRTYVECFKTSNRTLPHHI